MCANRDLLYVQSDIYRNKFLDQNPTFLKNIQEILGQPVPCWPLPANYSPYLYASIDVFISIQNCIAHVFVPFFIEILEESKKTKLVEISPYMLRYIQNNERTIYLTLQKEIHVDRIMKKTGCDVMRANSLFYFFSKAFSRIDNLILVDKMVEIDKLYSDEFMNIFFETI